MKFERLFEPVRIGKVPIGNRIVMAAMAPIGLVDRGGGLTQRAIDYYAERAFGGVGLIVVGVTRVTDMEPKSGYLFVSRESLHSLSELAELVHYYGSRVFVQLTPGYGRNIQGWVIDSGFKPISPSALPTYWRPNVTARALATEEVEDIVEAFGEAAELLKVADIDGIELQGYGGYLLDEFTTARWNKRNDKYGGCLENRLRFPTELLRAIKDRAGMDFPVIYRYSVKHFIKGTRTAALPQEDFVEVGRDVGEGLQMAKLLESAGFDALHVNAGCYDSWYWAYPTTYQPHGVLAGLAAQVKKCVTIPVIAVSRLDIPELAERVLEEGKADMVALGRALLADPHWPKKVREGEPEHIRPCTGCNECLYRIAVDSRPLSCAVNPACGREGLLVVGETSERKKVLVVGGGIAGMEAARVSAIKGHRVTLYEKAERVGGHLVAGSVPDFKQDIKRLLDWYTMQLEALGVEIRLRAEVTPELVKKEKPDKVIVATGSTPLVPCVPGIEKPIVASCTDLLLGRKRARESVMVIGSGLVGCETALWLTNQGKKVTIVEVLSEIGTGRMFHANRVMLLDMLREKKVEFMTSTCLEAVREDGVIVKKDSIRKFVRCDTVALALGLSPERGLYDSLKGEVVELYLIGDCKEPRKIMDAVWEAYHVALR